MIGSLPRFVPLDDDAGAVGDVERRAGRRRVRAAVRFESASKPPIFSFSVTNSSGVIAPDEQRLQAVLDADVVAGLPRAQRCRRAMPAVVPHTAVARSASPQRVPFGLVTGS